MMHTIGAMMHTIGAMMHTIGALAYHEGNVGGSASESGHKGTG